MIKPSFCVLQYSLTLDKESKLSDKVEGNFLNREKNGEGKEYNLYNRLIFEGEFFKGKKNGLGKEYNNNGFLIFKENI